MLATTGTSSDPWRLEVVVVTGGAVSSTERRSIARERERERERGRVLRLAPGASVERVAFGAVTPADRHIVRMRALVGTSSAPLVFSHWSAGVLHGLPVLTARLEALHHVTAGEALRQRRGVRPASPRPSFEAHCVAARTATPRRPPREPRWRV